MDPHVTKPASKQAPATFCGEVDNTGYFCTGKKRGKYDPQEGGVYRYVRASSCSRVRAGRCRPRRLRDSSEQNQNKSDRFTLPSTCGRRLRRRRRSSNPSASEQQRVEDDALSGTTWGRPWLVHHEWYVRRQLSASREKASTPFVRRLKGSLK